MSDKKRNKTQKQCDEMESILRRLVAYHAWPDTGRVPVGTTNPVALEAEEFLDKLDKKP